MCLIKKNVFQTEAARWMDGSLCTEERKKDCRSGVPRGPVSVNNTVAEAYSHFHIIDRSGS